MSESNLIYRRDAIDSAEVRDGLVQLLDFGKQFVK